MDKMFIMSEKGYPDARKGFQYINWGYHVYVSFSTYVIPPAATYIFQKSQSQWMGWVEGSTVLLSTYSEYFDES